MVQPCHGMERRPRAYLLFAYLFIFVTRAAAAAPATVHTIFSTECNPYFDWQTMGLVYTAKKVGQPGPVTRLMACDNEKYDHKLKDVDTHVHPNWAVHPKTGDHYSPYNKPASIIHWLEHAKPTAEYVIILDADMVIRHPITIELTGAARGRPVSAHYGYLVGIFPDHYMKVKERVKNVDKAQQVGGFSIMHIEDLKLVAPLWLKWTEEVRMDKDSWGNTGDIFNGNGKNGPPWISEMYGYVFACAEVGLDFQVSDKFMLYPGYEPPSPEPWPLVMHYGITYNVMHFAFDKHWYMSSDMTTCPGRRFQKPPDLDTLPVDKESTEYRRFDVALSVARGLYEASRQHAIDVCGIADPPDAKEERFRCTVRDNNMNICLPMREGEPPDPEFTPVKRDEKAAKVGLRGIQKCINKEPLCCDWASKGECTKNEVFMKITCAAACNRCEGGVSCVGTGEKVPETVPELKVAPLVLPSPPPVVQKVIHVEERTVPTVLAADKVSPQQRVARELGPAIMPKNVGALDGDYDSGGEKLGSFSWALWGGGLLGVGILVGRRLETYSRRTLRHARTAVRKGV